MRPSRPSYPPVPSRWGFAWRRTTPSGCRRASTAFAVALVAIGLLLGGCGRTVRLAAGSRAKVFLMEFRLRPDRISARRGELALVVRNLGRLTHSLSISKAGKAIASTGPIPPGGSARLSVTLAAGTYRMASGVQTDQALGMRGRLRVTRR